MLENFSLYEEKNDDRVPYNLSHLNQTGSGKLQFLLSYPDSDSLYFSEDSL